MRALRSTVVVALLAWLILGSWYSVRGLVRHQDDGARWTGRAVVGRPLEAARIVAAVRRLLPRGATAADRNWLVVLPPSTPPVSRAYVRQQLAYLHYPMRIDIALADRLPGLGGFAGIVAGAVVPAVVILAVRSAMSPTPVQGRGGEHGAR